MNAIDEVISLMSNKDKQAFITYLSKKNKRFDTGNIELFRLLETDDINALEKFRRIKSADAYHAMSKRLYDSLVEFMANRSFANDTSEEQEVLRLLVVSRVFFEHKLYKAAFKCLAKAEAKAAALEQFALLNEIYRTRIQFAHFDPSTPLERLLQKYEANRKKLEQEERLNLAYAVLRRELGAIYHQGKVVDLTSLIQETIKSYGISLKHALTYRSLYQILFIANEYASINSDYSLISPFVMKAYRFIAGREGLAEKHLYYHIYILYFIANSHFRNRRYAESGSFLDKMQAEMDKQGGKYHQRFCHRYFLLRALNANYSGNPGNAIHIAEKALQQHKKADPNDINDLRLCATVLCLQHDNGRQAIRHFKEFSHTDAWYEKKMGMDWAIRKSLVEVILHAQLENTEMALSRLKSFRRRYRKYLESVSEERVLVYASLLEKYIARPEIIKTHSFSEAIAGLIGPSGGNADIFVVSFAGWLLAKTERKPVYETTLQLLDHFSPFHSA